MKFPFVSRKKYENERGRIVVFIPAEYPKLPNGEPVQIPSDDICYVDKRVGWAKRKEFKTYADYIEDTKKADKEER